MTTTDAVGYLATEPPAPHEPIPEKDLPNHLGEWVTVRNPDLPGTWFGRLIGLHSDPGLLLAIPGRGATCLPRRFTVTPADPPAFLPAAEGLPEGALDSAETGAAMLDAWARTPGSRNLLAHALVQLARDGWLRPVRGEGFEVCPEDPRAVDPEPCPPATTPGAPA